MYIHWFDILSDFLLQFFNCIRNDRPFNRNKLYISFPFRRSYFPIEKLSHLISNNEQFIVLSISFGEFVSLCRHKSRTESKYNLAFGTHNFNNVFSILGRGMKADDAIDNRHKSIKSDHERNRYIIGELTGNNIVIKSQNQQRLVFERKRIVTGYRPMILRSSRLKG